MDNLNEEQRPGEPDPIGGTGTESAWLSPQEPNVEPSAPSHEDDAREESEGGILTGTASEQAPGVGGTGDHPAPAAVIDPIRGGIHVAGEPPAGTVAGTAAPVGDGEDVQSGGDVTDAEARERLNAVTEPEQVETERPDIGTD